MALLARKRKEKLMYEKILVPLDGSKVAEAALPNVENLVIRMAPKLR